MACTFQMAIELAFKKYIKDFKDKNITDPSSSGALGQTCRSITDYQSKVNKSATTGGFISMFSKSPVTFYREISEYFGDGLTLKLPEMLELKSQVFMPTVREIKTSISDPQENKSGEELLEELVEQVKQEESVKKQEDMKRQEKVKMELEEKNEWWRREKERRMVDHRQQLQMVQQRKLQDLASDIDSEIVEVVDVVGSVDKLGGGFQTHGYQQSTELGIGASGSRGASPGQGIKMTFTKKSKLMPAGAFLDLPGSDFTEIKEREVTGSSRKRKHGSISPEEEGLLYGALGNSIQGMFFTDSDSVKASPSKFRKKDGGY